MKRQHPFTWIVVLLFTSTLTGARPWPDADLRSPSEMAVEPAPEVGAAGASEPLGGCRDGMVPRPDRTAAGPRPYDREAVTFAVRFKDEVSPYRRMSLFALPGEKIGIGAVAGGSPGSFTACAEGGELTRRSGEEWTWRAPAEPGLYSLRFERAGESLLLNAFVMVPYDGGDRINEFRVGSYERAPLHGNPVYQVPRGMVEVTPDLLDVWLSPHFQLRQFLCKQAVEYPTYLILGERLLLMLESLLEKANERGIEADTFAVMSGFRTPHYNRSIGNETRYSRHLYGDAADIYVDQDGDGNMDDLDGDGKSDAADARMLAGIVEDGVDEAWYRPFVGGLGIYGPAPHRGPFIHVDTRGFSARWSS